MKGLIRIFRYVDDYIVFVKKKECKEISDSIKKVVRDRGLEFSEFSVIPPKDGRYKINFLGYSLLKTKRKKTIVEISTKKIYKKVLSKIDSINSDSTMNEHDRKKMLQFYIYGGEFILENKTIIRWGVKFAYPLAVSGLNKPADNKHIRRKLCSISFPPKSKGMNLKSIKSLYKRIVYTHPEYKSIKSGVVGKIKSVERYISDLSKKQKTAFYKSIPKVMR